MTSHRAASEPDQTMTGKTGAAVRFTTGWLALAALGVCGAVLVGAVVGRFLPPAFDYEHFFRPAARALAAGQNPYSVQGYISPPWQAALFVPLLLFSVETGRGILVVVSLVCFVVVARHFGAGRIALLAFMLSPPLLYALWQGTTDAVALAGFALPAAWGIWLIVMKPQMAAGPVVYWLVADMRARRWRRLAARFGGVAVAFVVSLLVWGPWPLTPLDTEPRSPINASPWTLLGWPSALIGLAILAFAIRRHNLALAFWASFFVSPYTAAYGALILHLPLLRHRRAAVGLTLLWWLLVAVLALQRGVRL